MGGLLGGGRGGKGYVGPTLSNYWGGGLGPPGPPLPTSSYAYDLNPKKKSVCVCVGGGGGGGGRCCVWGEVLEIKLFFRRGGSGSAAKGGLTGKVGIPYL